MIKNASNQPCPCGSGQKYKKCCRKYHQGAQPSDALILMKSRYSAYAVGESAYIIKTTHPENPEFNTDFKVWQKSIDTFCRESDFLGLKILAFTENVEEAFVTFEARLGSGVLREKSRFRKLDGKWLYLDGVFF